MVHSGSSSPLVIATLLFACSLATASSQSTLGAGEGGTTEGSTTTLATTTTTGTSTDGVGSTMTEGSTSAALSSTGTDGPNLDLGMDEDMGGGDGCSKIDFIFTIDGTARMKYVYESLLVALPRFIEAIDEVFPNVDVHIMVVHGDDSWGSFNCPINKCSLEEGCQAIKEPDYPCDVVHEFEEMPECDRKLGAGITFPAGREASNSRCELAGGRRYLTREEPDLAGAFVCIASRGYSLGVDAIGWAPGRALNYDLNRPGGCNEGFLREDAHLVVTVISDGGGYYGSYNPKVWADLVIDGKGGEQDAVSLIAILNDDSLPGKKCAEPTVNSWLIDYAEYFEHRLVTNLCEDSLELDFDAGLEMVRAHCEAAR